MRISTIFLRNTFSTIKFNTFTTRSFSTLKQSTKRNKICIVGSGPAGFYAAQYILKHLPNSDVDVLERLPVPYGLVRFGVAPDHPEVKNVINTFSKLAENKSFRFLGNLCLGKDYVLNELRERYHAVLLTYGAEKDRKLNIPNEDINENHSLLSAREFVAWYNGLPGYQNLQPNLMNSKTVTIIGQGNVAIDVARILLCPVDQLKSTDITEYALENLCKSQVKKVYLIGRRGPLQAAFTIKELREMLKLPNVITKWRKADFEGVNDVLSTLQRPRKRLTELMLKSLQTPEDFQSVESQQPHTDKREFLPIFMRSPISIKKNSIELQINKVIDNQAISTNQMENIETDLILRSIGYKSINVDEHNLNFDEKNGYVKNINGRVLKKDSPTIDTENNIDYGLYVAGWLATGPLGVILTTMNGAFAVANTICEDIKTNRIQTNDLKSGIDFKELIKNKQIVTWDGWKRIDEAEILAGKKKGKSREKIVDINEMLRIAEGSGKYNI